MTVRSENHPLGRFADRDTGVRCPECGDADLTALFTCHEALFRCPDCGAVLLLSELVHRTSEDEFSRLAALVNDRFSDRV